jgi:5-methylcytosine-specific restriction endonuclease McrA
MPRCSEYTQEDIGRLEGIQNKCCYYCGASEKPLQVEHLVPVSKGGTNFISNIVLACAHCNASKHSKTDLEFWKHLKKKHPPEWIKERKAQAKEIQKLKLRT